MGTNYSTTDGFSTQRDCEYYAERARGGVAMKTSVLAAVKSLGVPFVQVGNCSAPGNFLSTIRDGWIVGLRIDEQTFTGKKQ
jgi:2,4-dienoyl-CoA reductase-like NADH-dependent reductase (Old Yellow Enzyme family)